MSSKRSSEPSFQSSSKPVDVELLVEHAEALPEVGQPVIQVTGISKCYHSYEKPLHRLLQTFTSNKQLFGEFWALKNVDLTVYRGETVGIVGKNGSGKSTLLQIITGILQPTSGQCETHGRISALLELGAGFNPEFTGIENARLNASIMGLSRDELRDKLPDIIEFSGIGDFINRPVKTYSSGMFVRLAFAVAINMNPDILIIDEALAVGDVRFQRKCFRRLDELKNQGVSILFVTHSTSSVINHCDRAIMLDGGELKMTGGSKDVVQAYLEMMFASDIEQTVAAPSVAINANQDFDATQDYCLTQTTYNNAEYRWGDQRARIVAYELFNNGKPVGELFDSGQPLTVRMKVYFEHKLDDLIYGLTIKTAGGNAIYGTNSRLLGDVRTEQQPGDLMTLDFHLQLNLLAGDYFVSLGVAQDHDDKDNIAIDRRYDLIHLHINPTPESFGIAALNATLEQHS